MVTAIMAACEGIKIEERREVTEDYAELVVYTSDLEEWTAKIGSVTGPPAKPAGEKPTSQHNTITDSFGGIHKEQTLFHKQDGESTTVVMFWPWGDGEHTTVKMARTSAVAEAAPAGASPIGKIVKWVLIVLVAIVVLIAAYVTITMIRHNALAKATVVEFVDPRTVADGMYEGECDLLIVTARANVTVSQGTIVDIQLLEHDHGPGHGAEAMIPAILDAQSLDVDAVTGSTSSSLAVRKAVQVGLSKGVVESPPSAAEPEEAPGTEAADAEAEQPVAE